MSNIKIIYSSDICHHNYERLKEKTTTDANRIYATFKCTKCGKERKLAIGMTGNWLNKEMKYEQVDGNIRPAELPAMPKRGTTKGGRRRTIL